MGMFNRSRTHLIFFIMGASQKQSNNEAAYTNTYRESISHVPQ